MAGTICNCILPEALKINAVPHDPNSQPYESKKRSLTSTLSCLSSISMRQKQLSTSSLFLRCPLWGCLPSWELKRSNNGSLKERWCSSFDFEEGIFPHPVNRSLFDVSRKLSPGNRGLSSWAAGLGLNKYLRLLGKFVKVKAIAICDFVKREWNFSFFLGKHLFRDVCCAISREKEQGWGLEERTIMIGKTEDWKRHENLSTGQLVRGSLSSGVEKSTVRPSV